MQKQKKKMVYVIRFVRKRDISSIELIRSRVLARELGQYPGGTAETSKILIGCYARDDDPVNDEQLVGYVAINRPEDGHKTPHIVPSWRDLHELRGLMVMPKHRQRGVARMLMHAVSRYVQTVGGDQVIASARRELVPFYEGFGFRPWWTRAYTVGKVTYIPGDLDVTRISPIFGPSTAFTKTEFSWHLPYPMTPYRPCPHGTGSPNVDPASGIVRADVLDAWFPLPFRPSISRDEMRMTPQDPDRLIRAIARARDVPPENIIVAPGSSALMYTVFPIWFPPASRVVVITPTYQEYTHLLDVLGCRVIEVHETVLERTPLVDVLASIGDEAPIDGLVVVNPNSPSGTLVPGLFEAFDTLDIATRIWIDETYIEYAPEESVERLAWTMPNVLVAKSMSKCWAVSGVRLAYVCASNIQLDAIRRLSPPWWVSRIAQRIGAHVFEHGAYYERMRMATRENVTRLIDDLDRLGFTVIGDPVASFASFRVPERVDADHLIDWLRARGIFIKRCHGYPNSVRIAAQSKKNTTRMVREIRDFVGTHVRVPPQIPGCGEAAPSRPSES